MVDSEQERAERRHSKLARAGKQVQRVLQQFEDARNRVVHIVTFDGRTYVRTQSTVQDTQPLNPPDMTVVFDGLPGVYYVTHDEVSDTTCVTGADEALCSILAVILRVNVFTSNPIQSRVNYLRRQQNERPTE